MAIQMKKYDYVSRIQELEDMLNQGLSMRAAEKKLGFPETSMIQWLRRNAEIIEVQKAKYKITLNKGVNK